jgi:hypothetical protein
MTALAAVAGLAAWAAGCAPESGVTDGRYRHEGYGFSVPVPAGWSHEELSGELVVELQGPSGERGVRPTVHVFSRRELEPVDLESLASAVAQVAAGEVVAEAQPAGELAEAVTAEIDVETPAAPVVNEAAQVGGLPGRRIVRPARAGAVALEQEILLAARGRQVWALIVARPPEAGAAAMAALEQVREGFTIE